MSYLALLLVAASAFAARAETCVPSATVDWLLSSDPLAAPVRPAECASVEQNPPDFGWPDVSSDGAYQVTVTYPDGRAKTLAATQNWINWDEVLPAGTYSWQVELTDSSGARRSRAREFTVSASATPFLVPGAAALLNRVTAASRPRGLPDSTTLTLMRGERQSAVSALQIAVGSQLSSALPGAATSSVESEVHDESQRTLNSLIAYIYTRQDSYFHDALRRVLNLASWDPRGSTSYAAAPRASRQIAWTLALGYDWLHPRLDAGQKNAVIAAIQARGADMYNDIIGPRSRIAKHPRDSEGHQTLVVLAVISTLLAGDLSEADTWLQGSLALAINATHSWGTEEGGFANGDAFGTRVVGELLVPWYILRWSAGVDLAQKAWVRNWSRFLAYFLPPGTPSGVFGDGAEHSPGEVEVRFAKGYTHFASTALGRWYAARLTGEDATRMEYLLSPLADLGSNLLPDETPNSAVVVTLGQAALHSDLADPARTSVYFKSSPAPYGSFDHSHADQNSFVVNAGGQRLAIDSGYYDGYKTQHWWHWYKQTRAHNAITFDGGKGQLFFEQDGKMGYGAITNYGLSPEREIVHGDATQAYGGALKEAKRSLVYLRPNLVLVYDRLASDTPRQWEWNIHAVNQMSVASDRHVLIENNGQRLCVEMLAGPTMRFTQTNLFSAAPGGNLPQQWHGNFSTVDLLGAAEFIALLNVGCTATWASVSNTSGLWSVLVGDKAVTISDIGISVGARTPFTVSDLDAAGNDTTAPSAPTGLTASAITPTSLTLAWSAATDNVGVTGYRVYRDATLVASAAGTSASLTGLSPSTLYTFTVAALDMAGNASAQSASLSVTTPAAPDTTAPSTPTGLAVSALTPASLTLTWSAATDNIGVTGYRLYRDGVQVADVAVTSYSDTGLTAARAYSYSVSAYDAAGNESAKSVAVSVNTPAPTRAPFSGTPIAIPGTFEAENFDRGGEGLAYHDNVPGNVGGQYRTSEDVDIFFSEDPAGGGYIVKHFEAGEWLSYTISVPTSGSYDIELRAATSSSFPNSAFHVEIDGVNVTGTVVLPDTGGWSSYQWVGRRSVQLAAGTHVLKVVSERPYFGLNTIRVTVTPPPPPVPYSGAPVSVPGVIEAENFDRGGEGVAYHDNVKGNAGGQYRLSEDVDIAWSSDSAGGGYVVTNTETGEWLAYTINVLTSGSYDIELRAATNRDFPNAAYHAEIDGVNVTGTVILPDTGGWSTFQWVGKKTVSLTAGMHVLKIVIDRQYFALNSIRVLSTSAPLPQGSAKLLFSSGFEGSTAVNPPGDFWGTGAWQGLVGADTTTGFTWPMNVWGGTARFQMIVGAPVNVTTMDNYMVNRIDTVTGRKGTPTRTLYSEVRQRPVSYAQDVFVLQPASEQGDMYISYWMKLQPDLVQKMTPQTWKAFLEWKTGGDYRMVVYIASWEDGCGGVKPNGRLFWRVQGDNEANGGLPVQRFWRVDDCSKVVPVGEWFKVEGFWHRSSGADGRVWIAVNGQVIVDRYGPNKGIWNAPINRIFISLTYSDMGLPQYQWIDDLEIWDGFPPASGNNPPYAPH